jgi:putative spermidine/putrescine transport system ATP-binding protein
MTVASAVRPETAVAAAPSGTPRAPAVSGTVRSSLGISMRRIGKAYRSSEVLSDVSLDVPPGEFLTLLGPSGSGKTTLLNIIAGFIEPDRGTLHFGDDDVTALPVNRRGLGMVFQNYALFPHMTVAENVAFPLTVRRLDKAEIASRVNKVLDLVKMSGLAGRSVGALSGGQRQRVALARAVVFSPQIVLMDEPLSALDKSLREEMQVEIRRLHDRIGATTIYVTHDQREALTISDRIAVMNGGRIVQCDAPRIIYEKPDTLFVARFIGETTIVPVTRAENGIRLPDGAVWQLARPLPDTRELALVLRAEQMQLLGEGTAHAARFAVTAREIIYQGDSLLILAQIDGAPDLTMAIRRPGPTAGQPSAGQRLIVGVDPDSIVVLPAAE